MFTTQVALVPLEGLDETKLDFYRELQLVASALQTQLSRDFGPTWNLSAVVSPFLCREDVPPQYLPVSITSEALPGPSLRHWWIWLRPCRAIITDSMSRPTAARLLSFIGTMAGHSRPAMS